MTLYTRKIIISVGVVALALFLGIANSGYSQNVSSASSSHKLLEDDGRSQDSDYSLRNGITVKRALETISRKEDLILSYDSDLLNSSDEISVTENHNSIDKTIREVLSDTELEYKIMETRHLVIYDKGEIGHVKGKVVDTDSWEYLTGAKLLLLKADADSTGDDEVEQVTYVDSTGKYDFNNVDTGTYIVKVTFNGYKQISKKVEIRNKQTTEKIFELERNN